MADRIGLVNIGNTCFLNVVLQALRHCPPINTIFLSETDIAPREKSNRKQLLAAFQTLIRDFATVSSPHAGMRPSLVPRGFFHSLHTVLRETDDYWYRPGEQCDAAEALQYILDSLHHAMWRKVRMSVSGTATATEHSSHIKAIKSWATFFENEYSPIVNHFNGQHMIKITCTKCGNVSERYEPWLMVKAPIPGADVVGGPAPTMKVCLDSAFESETIDDYACDNCKSKQRAVKSERISRLPPITIVSIKRFTNAGHKVRGLIPWDLDELDFRPWMAFDRSPFNDETSSVYKTFAVIEHHGSTFGGHYRMYARDSGDTWNEYDDSSVTTVTPDRVITPDSYIALLMPVDAIGRMNHSMKTAVEAYREYARGTAIEAEEA
jgi:ubiquitin C-terminal hydrolase